MVEGTLGCEVARLLMGWGIRKITLVDNGRVAMCNPLRQSLYDFKDCLNDGEYKVVAAENSLKWIFPVVEVKGHCYEYTYAWSSSFST